MHRKKYESNANNPNSCPKEEAETHLRSFANSFIDRNYVDRWIYFLVENPAKSLPNLHKFEQHLHTDHCEEIGRGSDTFPASLVKEFGTRAGVYFDGSEPPIKLSVGGAAELAAERSADAVFSLDAGKRALFFHHANGIYICERL